jgi:hypothetical protein
MSALQPVRFDDSAWPLLIVQLPPRLNDIDVVGTLIKGFDDTFRRSSRFSTVLDGSAVQKFPGTAERRALTDWMGDPARSEAERRFLIGTGLVLPSGPMRAFVSAINFVIRPVAPRMVTATQEESIEWCCERLLQAGIALTPAIGALRARRALSAHVSGRPRRTG